ncbi:MAG: SH3 domain-containing protein [Syntrophorhabdaceae bacterium]|nr:SH3 domain-containing protein [Syntrophorhabdaceae bacterium]
MQDMQTVKEDYLEYWGLIRHPFLLAPDSRMMHMAGQYYECLERLKYAIKTGKGGVLIVSEDAGLGKTTTIFKLIDDMKDQYGEAFKFAFIDHPTLTVPQMIAQITRSFTGTEPDDDKLKNLLLLKEALIEVKKNKGNSIIVIDEGQMLCETPEILQELRVLINLTHENEYLHTFILSGQRPLWDKLKSMPEFWQRLPIRYYFVPLRFHETKELIKHRLMKAGLEGNRDIFTEDAFEIIHRYSRGSPRTIIAMSDLALLIGYTNKAGKVTYKEVSKAINAMMGKGDTIQYMREEEKRNKGLSVESYEEIERGRGSTGKKEIKINDILTSKGATRDEGLLTTQTKSFIIVLAFMLFLVIGAIAGYFFASMGKREAPQGLKDEHIKKTQEVVEAKTVRDTTKEETKKEEGSPPPIQTETKIPRRMAVVNKSAANIRNAPDINAPRIGLIFENETIQVMDRKVDVKGEGWYRVYLYGNREGWISEKVVSIR